MQLVTAAILIALAITSSAEEASKPYPPKVEPVPTGPYPAKEQISVEKTINVPAPNYGLPLDHVVKIQHQHVKAVETQENPVSYSYGYSIQTPAVPSVLKVNGQSGSKVPATHLPVWHQPVGHEKTTYTPIEQQHFVNLNLKYLPWIPVPVKKSSDLGVLPAHLTISHPHAVSHSTYYGLPGDQPLWPFHFGKHHQLGPEAVIPSVISGNDYGLRVAAHVPALCPSVEHNSKTLYALRTDQPLWPFHFGKVLHQANYHPHSVLGKLDQTFEPFPPCLDCEEKSIPVQDVIVGPHNVAYYATAPSAAPHVSSLHNKETASVIHHPINYAYKYEIPASAEVTSRVEERKVVPHEVYGIPNQ